MIDIRFQDMEGCVKYLGDNLIYSSNTEAEHKSIVEKVIQQYVEHELGVNLLKSELHVYKTIYLIVVINMQEVKMGLSKLETMYKWPIPTKKK